MKDFHKSLLKTALSIIILTILVLYAYFVEYKKSQEEAVKKEEETKVIKNIKKEDITQIKITHKDGKTIDISKENDKFIIKSPISSETDKNVIDTIISTIENLKSTTRFKDNERLSNYGLTTPSLTLEFRLSNGNSKKLLFGMRNDFDGKYYMKLDDSDEIFMIEGYVKGNMDKDLFSLRDKSIFKVETNEIKKIEYKIGDIVYIFEQKENVWEMVSPQRVRADEDEINKLKNSIKNLSAKAFYEEGKTASDFGLDRTTEYLKIYKGSDMAVSLINISRIKEASGEEKVYVMRQNTNVPIEVESSFYKDLNKTPFDYTFKKILDFEREKIFKIELIDQENKYTFIKEQTDTSTDWYFVDGEKRERLKYYKVSSLLYFLSDTKATKMLASNPVIIKKFNLDKPQKSIIIYDSLSKETGSVRFGSKDTEGLPLISSIRSEICFIEPKKFDEVSFVLSDYLEEVKQDAGQDISN